MTVSYRAPNGTGALACHRPWDLGQVVAAVGSASDAERAYAVEDGRERELTEAERELLDGGLANPVDAVFPV